MQGRGAEGQGAEAGSSMITERKGVGVLSFDIFVASPLAFRHVIIDE